MGLLQRLARSNGNQQRKDEANALIKDRLDKQTVIDWMKDLDAEIRAKNEERKAQRRWEKGY